MKLFRRARHEEAQVEAFRVVDEIVDSTENRLGRVTLHYSLDSEGDQEWRLSSYRVGYEPEHEIVRNEREGRSKFARLAKSLEADAEPSAIDVQFVDDDVLLEMVDDQKVGSIVDQEMKRRGIGPYDEWGVPERHADRGSECIACGSTNTEGWWERGMDWQSHGDVYKVHCNDCGETERLDGPPHDMTLESRRKAATVEEADIDKALKDPEHHGFGYKEVRDDNRAKLDPWVVSIANEIGLNYNEFFQWLDSKPARHLADEVSFRGVSEKLVRKYLNRVMVDKVLESVRQVEEEGRTAAWEDEPNREDQRWIDYQERDRGDSFYDEPADYIPGPEEPWWEDFYQRFEEVTGREPTDKEVEFGQQMWDAGHGPDHAAEVTISQDMTHTSKLAADDGDDDSSDEEDMERVRYNEYLSELAIDGERRGDWPTFEEWKQSGKKVVATEEDGITVGARDAQEGKPNLLLTDEEATERLLAEHGEDWVYGYLEGYATFDPEHHAKKAAAGDTVWQVKGYNPETGEEEVLATLEDQYEADTKVVEFEGAGYSNVFVEPSVVATRRSGKSSGRMEPESRGRQSVSVPADGSPEQARLIVQLGEAVARGDDDAYQAVRKRLGWSDEEAMAVVHEFLSGSKKKAAKPGYAEGVSDASEHKPHYFDENENSNEYQGVPVDDEFKANYDRGFDDTIIRMDDYPWYEGEWELDDQYGPETWELTAEYDADFNPTWNNDPQYDDYIIVPEGSLVHLTGQPNERGDVDAQYIAQGEYDEHVFDLNVNVADLKRPGRTSSKMDKTAQPNTFEYLQTFHDAWREARNEGPNGYSQQYMKAISDFVTAKATSQEEFVWILFNVADQLALNTPARAMEIILEEEFDVDMNTDYQLLLTEAEEYQLYEAVGGTYAKMAADEPDLIPLHGALVGFVWRDHRESWNPNEIARVTQRVQQANGDVDAEATDIYTGADDYVLVIHPAGLEFDPNDDELYEYLMSRGMELDEELDDVEYIQGLESKFAAGTAWLYNKDTEEGVSVEKTPGYGGEDLIERIVREHADDAGSRGVVVMEGLQFHYTVDGDRVEVDVVDPYQGSLEEEMVKHLRDITEVGGDEVDHEVEDSVGQDAEKNVDWHGNPIGEVWHAEIRSSDNNRLIYNGPDFDEAVAQMAIALYNFKYDAYEEDLQDEYGNALDKIINASDEIEVDFGGTTWCISKSEPNDMIKGASKKKTSSSFDPRRILTDIDRSEWRDGAEVYDMGWQDFQGKVVDFVMNQASSNIDAAERAAVAINDMAMGSDDAMDLQAEISEVLEAEGVNQDARWHQLMDEFRTFMVQSRRGAKEADAEDEWVTLANEAARKFDLDFAWEDEPFWRVARIDDPESEEGAVYINAYPKTVNVIIGPADVDSEEEDIELGTGSSPDWEEALAEAIHEAGLGSVSVFRDDDDEWDFISGTLIADDRETYYWSAAASDEWVYDVDPEQIDDLKRLLGKTASVKKADGPDDGPAELMWDRDLDGIHPDGSDMISGEAYIDTPDGEQYAVYYTNSWIDDEDSDAWVYGILVWEGDEDEGMLVDLEDKIPGNWMGNATSEEEARQGAETLWNEFLDMQYPNRNSEGDSTHE